MDSPPRGSLGSFRERKGLNGDRLLVDDFMGIGGFSGGQADGPTYEIEVNEGSANMRHFTKVANDAPQNGYRMAHVFSQERNTIVVWERRSG